MTANLSIVGISSSEYLSAMECVIVRALRDGVSALHDPRIACPRSAKRYLDSIVEMLAGFTLGTVVHNLRAGVVRWFDNSLARELLRSVARGGRLQLLDADINYLDDAKDRPIVNELAVRLHLRYCAMPQTLAEVLRELDSVPNKHRVRIMLGYLRNDADELVRCMTDEIRFAWSMFSAAAAGKVLPGIEGRMARSATMWSTWITHVATISPHSPSQAPSRDQAQDAGYIMLVA